MLLPLDHDDYSFAAQLALLQKMTFTLSRLLRKPSDASATPVLLAAKIFVIARLLHKTVSQKSGASPPAYLDTLRQKLQILQRKLLKHVDRQLLSLRTPLTGTVDALSAFCLATSSSLSDAVRRFHRVRSDGVKSSLSNTQTPHGSILKAFKIFVNTLNTTKALLPRKLSDGLSRLTAKPLIEDAEIRELDELEIDLYERWLASEARNFTPWIKHNDLNRADAEKMVKGWSQMTFDVFTEGLAANLGKIPEFADLVTLRKELLDVWLPKQYSTPTHSSDEILEGLRAKLNARLTTVLRDQALDLKNIGLDVNSVITSWSSADSSTSKSLWDDSLAAFDYSNGAPQFKREILARAFGETPTISQVLRTYRSWLSSIEECAKKIEELKKTRWDDIDIDEDEDEEFAIDVTSLLNKEDPAALRKEQVTALTEAFKALEKSLLKVQQQFKSDEKGAQSAFLLRIIRGIRYQLPAQLEDGERNFALSLVPGLQADLATHVTARIPINFLINKNIKRVPGRGLWEGDPALPIQPSPSVIRMLRSIGSTMAEHGTDLWTPAAVGSVKDKLCKAISEAAEAHFKSTSSTDDTETSSEIAKTAAEASPREDTSKEEDESSEKEDGVSKSADQDSPEQNLESPSKDVLVQSLFDLLFLQQVLVISSEAGTSTAALTGAVTLLKEKSELSDPESKRITRVAGENWKRVSLLFGLLA